LPEFLAQYFAQTAQLIKPEQPARDSGHNMPEGQRRTSRKLKNKAKKIITKKKKKNKKKKKKK